MTGHKLYPYQREGVEWLKTKRFALLADQMGLGKTAQVITAADELGCKNILIICPSIARITWQREFKLWSRASQFTEIMTKRSDRPDTKNTGVVICSFDYVTNNAHILNKIKWDLLVVDESHFLKSMDSKRTKAVLSKTGVVHASRRIYFLSGTPMPNHPGELWPMLHAFGGTDLPYYPFTFKFCEGYEFNGRRVITGARRKALPELRESLQSLMLRRETKNVLPDLPPVRISELVVEAKLEKLTPQLKEEMDKLQDVLKHLENESPTKQLEALSIMASSIATLRRYCAMMKVKPIVDLITEELENGAYEKIVIFGIHREAIAGIQEGISKFNCVRIDGSVSPIERQRAIDLFQNDPSCRAIAANISAAGTNISLTASSQMLLLEQDWVPGNNAQAIARCARIGQKNSVYVRVASLQNTVDERVQSILLSKTMDIKELLK